MEQITKEEFNEKLNKGLKEGDRYELGNKIIEAIREELNTVFDRCNGVLGKDYVGLFIGIRKLQYLYN